MTKITVSSGSRGFTANWDMTAYEGVLDLLDELVAERGRDNNREPITITAAGRKVTIPAGKLNQVQQRAARKLGYL